MLLSLIIIPLLGSILIIIGIKKSRLICLIISIINMIISITILYKMK